MSVLLLSSPLQGGRVLEFSRQPGYNHAWRLSVTQIDGAHRRQVGGFDLTPAELPLFFASLKAIAAYTGPARAS